MFSHAGFDNASMTSSYLHILPLPPLPEHRDLYHNNLGWLGIKALTYNANLYPITNTVCRDCSILLQKDFIQPATIHAISQTEYRGCATFLRCASWGMLVAVMQLYHEVSLYLRIAWPRNFNRPCPVVDNVLHCKAQI